MSTTELEVALFAGKSVVVWLMTSDGEPMDRLGEVSEGTPVSFIVDSKRNWSIVLLIPDENFMVMYFAEAIAEKKVMRKDYNVMQ